VPAQKARHDGGHSRTAAPLGQCLASCCRLATSTCLTFHMLLPTGVVSPRGRCSVAGAMATKRLVPKQPAFVIDGRPSKVLASRLAELLVLAGRSAPSRCHARFTADPADKEGLLKRGILDFGKTIEIHFGSDRAFGGTIVELAGDFPADAPPSISLVAEDGLARLHRRSRTRTFEHMCDADVIARLASDHGLSLDVDGGGPAHECIVQANQDDLSFLLERAEAANAEVIMEDDTLHVHRRRSPPATSVPLVQGRNLRWFSVVADLSEQRTAVVAAGWDAIRAEVSSREASATSIAAELGSDESGAALLARSFGERRVLLPCSGDAEVLQAAADAAFMGTARRFVVARGEAEADVGLRVGAMVEIKGVGAMFSGRYRLTEVRHRFDASKGLRSEFSCERPGLGRN
jgi:uncharacterized protein